MPLTKWPLQMAKAIALIRMNSDICKNVVVSISPKLKQTNGQVTEQRFFIQHFIDLFLELQLNRYLHLLVMISIKGKLRYRAKPYILR